MCECDESEKDGGRILSCVLYPKCIPYDTPNGDTVCLEGIPYETPNDDG